MKTCAVLFLSALAFSGCMHQSGNKQRTAPVTPATVELTHSQHFYLNLYKLWRVKLTDYFSLPVSATPEEVRPYVLQELSLPLETPWEGVIQTPLVSFWLTEERRSKIVRTFRLDEHTTWVQMMQLAEQLRVKAK